jgi:hypothetical protein
MRCFRQMFLNSWIGETDSKCTELLCNCNNFSVDYEHVFVAVAVSYCKEGESTLMLLYE